MSTIAQIAVENTVYHFDKAFDYLIPLDLAENAKPGCRVLVPFGTANHKRQGMILSLAVCNEPPQRIKPVLALLDQTPLLNEEAVQLVYWMKERYFCTFFDAVKLLLPVGINLKVTVSYFPVPEAQWDRENLDMMELRIMEYLGQAQKPVVREKLCDALGISVDHPSLVSLYKRGLIGRSDSTLRKVGDATQKMVRFLETDGLPKLTPKQKNVYEVLLDVGSASLKELCYFTGVTNVVVDSLVKKGLAEYYETEIYRNPYKDVPADVQEEQIHLSEEQECAYQNLLGTYYEGKAAVSLLYGVTGSGKTSVFMRLIDRVYAEGRGVIVMVPEISLTPQTIALFHRRYGKRVAVFHSGLSLGERMDEWKRVKNGEAAIAVGTRSAVFAPFDRLGLIIMDEEQEYTYKSESSPRYHARDVAKFRCGYHKALLVLSSATPSIESFYQAQKGRYGFNKLSARYGNAVLPDVSVVDMNWEAEAGNTGVLSRELLSALERNLQEGRQSILLLNRRGYNTFASCRSCGHVMTCPNCSISLTYHSANGRLMCHYCGYSIPFSTTCPECHEEKVHYAGVGTQRAEKELQEVFPNARVLRLDTDSTMVRGAYEKQLELFSKGEYEIIIGTQMVAKGLDFQNVTLVGVLSADQALYSDDFRSYERAFDLLTQVVGRSGRGAYKGRAIIQTYTPENPIIQLAAKQDYETFFDAELSIRKAMLYPPFADICVVGFVGMKEKDVARASRQFLSMLSLLAQQRYSDQPMRVLNPAPALVAKVSNKYRYRIIIKCRNNLKFREMVSQLLIEFSGNREYSGVTVFADINPDMVI